MVSTRRFCPLSTSVSERRPAPRRSTAGSHCHRAGETATTDRVPTAGRRRVHASSTDHRIWVPHAKIIAQRYRVIAPTQRYFGTSPWPDDGRTFSISTHAADLADFIDGLQVGPVALVGWSYGAAVCLAMAVEQPEVVRRLVLYEPAIISFVDEPAAAQAAAADRQEMIAPAR